VGHSSAAMIRRAGLPDGPPRGAPYHITRTPSGIKSYPTCPFIRHRSPAAIALLAATMRSRWRRIAMFRDEALQPHVACSTEEVRPDLAPLERIDEQALRPARQQAFEVAK